MRVRQARGRRSRIRFGIVAALLVGGWAVSPPLETAHGYRFFSDGNDDELVGADDAMRWSPDVWGPE